MMQNFRAAFRFWASVLTLGVALSVTSEAAASDTYPGAVQSALGTCTVRCTLCHKTLSGGLGTLNDKFGQAIQATANLPIRQPEAIPAALQRMVDGPCLDSLSAPPVNGPCDSDGDGVGDIDELRQGRDPNVSGEGNFCGGPTYGCGARVAPGSADFDWVSLLMAGAAAVTLIHNARRMRKRA